MPWRIPKEVFDAVGTEMFLRHQAELLFHLHISHRVLEMAAVIFDPGRLARA